MSSLPEFRRGRPSTSVEGALAVAPRSIAGLSASTRKSSRAAAMNIGSASRVPVPVLDGPIEIATGELQTRLLAYVLSLTVAHRAHARPARG
jgi:hypothetical protein